MYDSMKHDILSSSLFDTCDHMSKQCMQMPVKLQGCVTVPNSVTALLVISRAVFKQVSSIPVTFDGGGPCCMSV